MFQNASKEVAQIKLLYFLFLLLNIEATTVQSYCYCSAALLHHLHTSQDFELTLSVLY